MRSRSRRLVGVFLLLVWPAAMIGLVAPSDASRIGGTVSVLGVWGGSELASFQAMVKPFEGETGIHVQYEGTRDLSAVLTARVQGQHPPDVAELPNPGQMKQLIRSSALKPLTHVLDMDSVKREYAPTWLELGSFDGTLYGVFVKTALKGLIWYDPKVFAANHFALPSTWTDLLALTRRIASHAKTPWCIGLASGAATGWPATDWIEILLLKAAGPKTYADWYEHRISWDSPAVRTAWQQFGKIASNPAYVYGGTQGELTTNFNEAPFPLFTQPPSCYLHLQATFIQAFIANQYPSLRPGADVNFFAFPMIAPQFAGSIEVAGDVFGMFRDTPQARALLRYVITARAQAIWVNRGGALSPNKDVALRNYPDLLSRRAAQMLVGARAAEFDASDLMPPAVTDAFYKGTLGYVQHPGDLDAILRRLEQVARDAYK